MNPPSRTESLSDQTQWSRSPTLLGGDPTTRDDLVSSRTNATEDENAAANPNESVSESTPLLSSGSRRLSDGEEDGLIKSAFSRFIQVLRKFARFVGPGFLVAVAYIDPGNYATDVAAGADTKYALLFIIMVSNIFAVFLQSLSIKLGSVTGLNLAENCKAHLPKWLTIVLYIFAESAIIATDIAEVVGSAISFKLLFNIPLVAGCAITMVDVLVTLIFYNPQGSMKGLRTFEFFVATLVIGVVICFCIQLSMIEGTTVGEVLKGYLPSSAVVKSNGLYLSCGILGATVMPHSIFLGSGVVQSRLRQFDVDNGYVDPSVQYGSSEGEIKYRPSLSAIRECMNYSIAELILSLFTFALFVNSSILIVAAASLSGSEAADADLFGIYDLLSKSISPAAGTIFAVALLLSGISAGIVCTIAGQMVSEGMLNWTVAPWLRRLITRSISIVPSVIIAAVVGREGLNATLTASQVVLSGILPIVTAPLVYFTSRSRYMTAIGQDGCRMSMANGWFVTSLAVIIWVVITVLNIALLVLVAMGKAS
ncbi:hypothetical protein VTO42DRAFT_2493 [Malbranchea cinnamomea]